MIQSSLDDAPEPWLRGTLTDVPAVGRAVLHALQLADEDLRKWCFDLSEEEINLRPSGMSSVAFQMRHIARSLDRLLTYAEGKDLSGAQLAMLRDEDSDGAAREQLLRELATALENSASRVRALAGSNLEEARCVGKRKLPTTLGGLLVHVADHTQRHVGQAITTAKMIRPLQADASADKAE